MFTIKFSSEIKKKMRLFIRLVSINALLCIFGIHLPINSSELKSLNNPEINSKDRLFASNHVNCSSPVHKKKPICKFQSLKDEPNIELKEPIEKVTVNNVKTVITKGFGSTFDEASQNALKNALAKVVGAFIDSETRLEEKTTIVNGILSESANIQENINNYSQGSIKYFEILNTEERNGLFIVEAKVEVLQKEFSKFIKKFAFAESSFPGAEISTVIETNLSNKKSKAEIISNKIIKPLTEGTVYDINIGDWKFINDWRNFCAESFYYQNLMGGCGNFQNNSVILANVEISINKNFLKNAENIFEKTKSSTFYLNTGAGFYATTSSPSKSNDLKIAINKKTDSKIYLFKDIKNELSNYKGNPERNSHPLFFSNPLQLKRSKVGALRYGSPSISLMNSDKKEIFSYSCNVYDCPYSENIKFIPISNGVIPQFSLFGCVDIGNGCVSTIIPNAKYLIMLNFSTESLKAIKDIKVEYKKAS